MMWYAIYKIDTGGLISTGTVVAKDLPKDLMVKEIGEDFDFDGLEWDTKTLSFVPETPIPIFDKQEYLDNITTELNLTPDQKTKLTDLI